MIYKAIQSDLLQDRTSEARGMGGGRGSKTALLNKKKENI